MTDADSSTGVKKLLSIFFLSLPAAIAAAAAKGLLRKKKQQKNNESIGPECRCFENYFVSLYILLQDFHNVKHFQNFLKYVEILRYPICFVMFPLKTLTPFCGVIALKKKSMVS